jgi:hypothetical protein
MKENDIVTVVATTGEYVGKLLKMDETGVVLADPRMITYNEQGMGFAQGIAMTGNVDPKEVVILQAVFVTDCNPEVVKAWRQATSGLVMP